MAIVLENTTTRSENYSRAPATFSYTVPTGTTFLELVMGLGYVETVVPQMVRRFDRGPS